MVATAGGALFLTQLEQLVLTTDLSAGVSRLIEAGAIAQCDANALHQFTVVVMPTRHDRPSWGLTDPVAKVLGSCERPVLFVPVGLNHTEVAK